MAKTVVATVKTDNEIIIQGVNREKLTIGSASEVCERALLEYFQPARKHEFSVNDVEENRSSKLVIELNTNDLYSLHELGVHNNLSKEDLGSIILSRFVRGEIRFYQPAENPVIEPISQETAPEIETFTPTPAPDPSETETVNPDTETVIINLKELMIPEVIESLQKKGFDEMSYYTPQKEKIVNAHFSKLLNDVRAENQNEIQRLQDENNVLKQSSGDVEGLIEGTKICIKELVNIGVNPFSRFEKEEILKVFPEKLRPIFEV